MDPNANLREQLALARRIALAWDNCNEDGTLPFAAADRVAEDANRLADLVVALDDWIAKGGPPPGRWAKT